MNKNIEKDIERASVQSAGNKSSDKNGKGENRNGEALEMIIRSVNELEYGTITITIHNGSIVQVETNTKRRFA